MIRGRVIEKDSVKTNIHNKFVFEVRDKNTNELKETSVAYNLITDKMYNSYFISESWFTYIGYGEGVGVPSEQDVRLFKEIARVGCGNQVQKQNWDEQWVSYTKSITIDENTANGKTITEVGIYKTTGDTLCTHAMLQDMNGNPISILKKDTDRITIYATVYVHYSFDPNGLNPMTDGGFWLAPCFAGISTFNGTSCSGGGIDGKAYHIASQASFSIDRVNKKIKNSFKRTELTDCNAPGGIIGVQFGETWGLTYDSWFKANKIIGEEMGVSDGAKTKYATKFFGCVDPTVYVDGVIVNNYTCKPNMPVGLEVYGGKYVIVSGLFRKITENGTPVRPKYTQYGYDHPHWFDGVMYFENVFFDDPQNFKLYGVDLPNKRWIKGRDNIEDEWTTVTDFGINAKQYRYYAANGWNNSSRESINFYAHADQYNIIFDTPPAEGSKITIDYTPKCIAKDIKHRMQIRLSDMSYAGV